MYKVTLINDGVETIVHHHFFNDLKLKAGQIKEDINVANGFSFTIAPNNPGYKLIHPLKTLIKVENMKDEKVVFEGRVLSPTESMSSSGAFGKSFVCESELGYLNDSRQRHGEYHDITVRDFLQVMIDNHNQDIADDPIDKKFEIGIVDVDSSTGTLYRYLGYEKTFDAIVDKLIERLNGEIRVRKENGIRYLDYVQELGEVKHTEIRLAKNLQSITTNVDPTNLITRLVPLGERIESDDEDATDASQARLTIESVNDGKDYIVDEVTERIVGTVVMSSEVWDDVTQPNILKTRGQQHLRDHNRVKASYQISALDLSLIGLDTDSFDMYNWYPVVNPVMGIDEHLRVTGKTTDILNPERSTLRFGDKLMTSSEYQNQANKSQRKIVDLENTVERQSQRVAQLSQTTKNAQEEIQTLHDLIDNIDDEGIEESLTLITQQLMAISDAVDDIGHEVFEIELRMGLFDDFKDEQEHFNHEVQSFIDNQELVNDDYADFKEDVLQRLSALEKDNDEGGDDNEDG